MTGFNNRYGAKLDLLRIGIVSLGEWTPTFRLIVLRLPSRVKRFKKNLGLLGHKESTTIRNVESHSPNYAAPRYTRPTAATLLWEYKSPKGWSFSLWDSDWIFCVVRWILFFSVFRCSCHLDNSVFVHGKSHEIKRLFIRNLFTFKAKLLHTVTARATERQNDC